MNAFVVGVTGHRNLVAEDRPAIMAQVTEILREILSLAKGKSGGGDMPVVMLNALAEGADMLCAEAAFSLGIDVYAVLPCALEKYAQSFDDEEDKSKLSDYLKKCKGVSVAPDIEKCFKRFKAECGMDESSYEYRQLGIYLAQSSNVLIALWDGKPPKVKFGCGTVEVIDFALERGRAVAWVKCRRRGDGGPADISRKWIKGKRNL